MGKSYRWWQELQMSDVRLLKATDGGEITSLQTFFLLFGHDVFFWFFMVCGKFSVASAASS